MYFGPVPLKDGNYYVYFLCNKLYFRTFKIMDDDESRSLDYREFKKGIHDYGLTEMSDADIKKCFETFDKDGSGTIDFDEFLVNLRVSIMI